MSVSIETGKVIGVRELQTILRNTDKKLFAQTQAKIRKAAGPMVAQAKAITPSQAPLSGWAHSGRTGWRQSEVLTGLSAKTGGRRISATEWPLLSLIQKNPAGMIYDWAGRAGMSNSKPRSRPYPGRPTGHRNTSQGDTMVRRIPAFGAIKGSKYSRVLFPAFVATRGEVRRAMIEAIETVAAQVNVEIERI